jgi:hypothetical protein
MIAEPLFRIHRLVEQSTRRMLSLPSEAALKIFNIDFVEKTILLPRDQQLVQEHANSLPQLDPEGARIVAGLEQQGIYSTTLDALDLPNTQQFLTAAHSVSTELAQMAKSTRYTRYKGMHTLTGTAQQLLDHPEIFWWGTAERLLNIAERYFHLPVAYDGLSFYHSVANGKDGGPCKGHRDKEDWKMVKVVVYLHDVDENGGPYEQVKSEANRGLVDTTQPKYKTFTHLELQRVLRTDSSDWFRSCTGKAGTVLFVDTAQYYHRGKPLIASDRSAVFFSYFSRIPKNPFYCGRSPLLRQQLAALAQPLPAYVQRCITWREQMQSVVRYIPKNRVKV